jgi:hypothetical protein
MAARERGKGDPNTNAIANTPRKSQDTPCQRTELLAPSPKKHPQNDYGIFYHSCRKASTGFMPAARNAG